MITIVNMRNYKVFKPYTVKVDRSSPLGNPFVMLNELHRDEVCEKYTIYIVNKLKEGDKKIINEFKRLLEVYKKYGKLELACWCAPKRCHAETIRRLLELSIEKHKRNGDW